MAQPGLTSDYGVLARPFREKCATVVTPSSIFEAPSELCRSACGHSSDEERARTWSDQGPMLLGRYHRIGPVLCNHHLSRGVVKKPIRIP